MLVESFCCSVVTVFLLRCLLSLLSFSLVTVDVTKRSRYRRWWLDLLRLGAEPRFTLGPFQCYSWHSCNSVPPRTKRPRDMDLASLNHNDTRSKIMTIFTIKCLNVVQYPADGKARKFPMSSRDIVTAKEILAHIACARHVRQNIMCGIHEHQSRLAVSDVVKADILGC